LQKASIISIIASEEKRVAYCGDMHQNPNDWVFVIWSFLPLGALRTNQVEPLVVLGWLAKL
jgi:hypothetical protein